MLTHHALANQSQSGNGQAPTYMPRRTMLIGGALVTLLASSAGLPGVARAATVANPLCPAEVVFFAPGTGQDITVPLGVYGFRVRFRAECADRHRVRWRQEQFPSVCARIG